MTILLFLIIFIAWLIIDLKIGRIVHLKKIIKRNYPLRHGNWLLFGDGHELYTNLFQDIIDAKHHVHVLFYIVKNDAISHEFLNLLKKKANDGVTVRLLLDRIGSHYLSRNMIKELKDNGVHFSFSNKVTGPFLFYSLNYRNHRKITVIDGRIGYFGGFNIGKEYLGQDPYLGYWRDFHLKLVGDGVQDLQSEFIFDWRLATKELINIDQQDDPTLAQGSLPLQFFPTDGSSLDRFLIELIQKAEIEILIGSPYFIPGQIVFREILAARNRGVNITIVVPLKSDHVFVKEAAFPYFKKLLKAGCSVHRYTNGFYHGKILLIDHKICAIGTANFDKRSFYLNDEINCLIHDLSFIEKVRTEFLKDIREHSEQLTLTIYNKRPLQQRVKEGLSSLVSDLL